MSNLLFDLGLAALSGSALGGLISKYPSIQSLQAENPRLYDMLVAAGAVAANEMVEHEAHQEQQAILPQLRPPGWHV